MTEALKAVSWSELKTFQRCPKQWEYKYVDRLVPKKKSKPLFLGSWIHSALESYYTGGDWRIGHKLFLDEYNKLFEEEREALEMQGKRRGKPLPQRVESIMKSYEFYYKDDGWEVVAIEQPFEVDTPLKIDGKTQRFQGIIDLVIRDLEGRLWVVDHKTAGNIPEATAFHAMDPQLMLYPWAAKQAWGWDVAGVYYNYVRSKAPSVPKINRDGSISKRKFASDYPTLYRFLKSNRLDPARYADVLRPLRRQSPFLRRYRLPREGNVTKEILLDALSTAKRIRTDVRRYRVITRDCSKMCPYHDLCRTELNGFDTRVMREQNFTLKEERIFVDPVDGEYEEPDDEFEDE